MDDSATPIADNNQPETPQSISSGNDQRKTPIVIIEEEVAPETPKKEDPMGQAFPSSDNSNENEATVPNSGNQTPGHLQSNGTILTSFYEDDVSVGDFGEQNIMDEEDYDSNTSMNEMLSEFCAVD